MAFGNHLSQSLGSVDISAQPDQRTCEMQETEKTTGELVEPGKQMTNV